MAASTRVTLGSTYTWKLTATIDGAVWNLSSATVNLNFHRPDGSTSSFAASLVSGGTGGIAQYTNDTEDLDIAGQWRRSWEILDGSTVQRSLPIHFQVVETP